MNTTPDLAVVTIMHLTARSLTGRPTTPRTSDRPRATLRLRGWSAAIVVLGAAGLLAACSSNAAAPTTTTTTSPAAGSTAASTGSSAPVVATASKGSVGTVLVASDGHTLYRLTTDTPTTSSCSGSCAQLWPPLTVPAGTTPKAASGLTGTLGTITRSDGTVQVTYQGHPLYTYAADTTAADVLGQGVGGVWFVVSPSGSSSSPTTSPPTTAAGSGSGY